MLSETSRQPGSGPIELVTFFLGENQFGIDIARVRGINRVTSIVTVERAPFYVQGLLNLRGQVVTVIDLNRKLGLERTVISTESRIIIVMGEEERVGLLVDRVRDVVRADQGSMEGPPANLGGVQGSFFSGVHKADEGLVGLLDLDEILQIGE